MEQALRPIDCSIYDFLDLVGANLRAAPGAFATNAPAIWLGKLSRRLDQFNPLSRARQNVAHHYDLNERLYGLFLDADRQYSCAYFATGGETLEQAQAAKTRHIAAKLRLDRTGLRVLDIGSGWGGMALSLARDYGCQVEGITLSREQLAVSEARAQESGLAGQIRFRLMDYRDLDSTYDRIVSVGMFEHVGVNHYSTYFETVRRCLAPDGVALLHTIGRSDGPLSTNRWVKKYVFPGGYAPAMSEILPHVERSGLFVTDVEILRLHYAYTLRAWRERFAAQRDTIAGLYDERFCRMFEFYLAISEMSFRRLTHVNFQLQLTRDLHALPLTRDYMRAAEHLP
jgi:cyclopropane-fatty-acyl-phospholipid synthase